jgi:hypothetical protein
VETRSLVLRNAHGLILFLNRGLRKIFGPMKDEVTGEWRRLHKKELYDKYSTRMRHAGHVSRIRKTKAHAEFWWVNLKER